MTEIERFTPDMRGRIAYEHRHRYALCVEIAAKKDVLDIACGEGYGAQMLAAKAMRVVGVDIDAATIKLAKKTYGGNKRLKFETASCLSLPFPDHSFDVVVSFETIEHIAEHEAFLAEVSRVLRKDGVFIVSTPNRPVYSESSGQKNIFHKKELDEAELRGLLAREFKRVQLLGQRFYIPSVIGLLADDAPRAKKELAASLISQTAGTSAIEAGGASSANSPITEGM